MRVQLAGPNQSLLSPEQYDQLFSMHGITMIFLFVTPMLSGFGNYLVPLQIGARDMAFPRLNALSYWVFLGAGLFIYSSLPLGIAPDDGWFSYAPLSTLSPGSNLDFYGLGLIMLAISTTAGAINFIVTMARLRAPGMSLNRMPLFCWAILATSLSVVFALPALTLDCLLPRAPAKVGLPVLRPSATAVALCCGSTSSGSSVIRTSTSSSCRQSGSSRRSSLSSRSGLSWRRTWSILATMATAVIGFGVWIHHMFAVGLPQIDDDFLRRREHDDRDPGRRSRSSPGSRPSSPAGPVMKSPFLYIVGFIVVFVVGGLSGVMFAVIPFDQQVTDSYFVVAHFHYVLFGGAVFPIFAALHYWLPKMSGRLFDERRAQLAFWLIFVGFNLTFFPMHITGLLGMPRRVYTYPSGEGWGLLNLLTTIGAFVLAFGIFAMVANLAWSLVRGARRRALTRGMRTRSSGRSRRRRPPTTSGSSRSCTGARPELVGARAVGSSVLPDGHQTPGTSELYGDVERGAADARGIDLAARTSAPRSPLSSWG